VTSPALRARERIRWQTAANRAQGGRSVGGRIFLTNQRLVFEPNRIDSITGGRQWAVPLSAIHEVGFQTRDRNLFSGGLRNRLRLTCADGDDELIVVNHLDDVIDVLETARLAAG